MPPEQTPRASGRGRGSDEDRIRLRHMLDAARRAQRFCDGRSLAEFEADEMLLLATVKSVEVIGEASTRVTEGLKAALPDVPWRQIHQMRNRMIHGYDTVNVQIVWDTVQLDLPPLIAVLEAALAAWPARTGAE
jgi:uncharacterized protein with HEPN domain